MKLESQRIEMIIRYWVVLEELKRQKETVFGDETLHRQIVHFNPFEETENKLMPKERHPGQRF